MENYNLTPADVAMMTKHHDRSAMAATGIGLGAGLGGGALILALGLGWGISQYVATIRVQGIISYVPCNGGCSCTKTQPISQEFSVPIQSATAPTSVTVTAGTTINSIAANGCDKCSRTLVSETPISIAVA